MFVKFDPTLGTTSNQLRCYNFMRVITEVATAAAGSTPVVRPMTAANTFDTNIDLITSVIANNEAGGWQTSPRFDEQNAIKGHNLDNVGYTDTNFNNRLYRADFWRDSGKAQLPYLKFTVQPQVYSTWTSYPYVDIIHGAHTDKQYDKVSGYVPTTDTGNGGGYGYASVNLTGTAQDGTRATYHNIRPAETGVGANPWGQSANVSRSEWWLAVTAQYFILIQPWTSMTYFGLRSTNAWEDSYDDNPPIVGFNTPLWPWQRASTTTSSWQTFVGKKHWAWMKIKDGSNAVRAQPYLCRRSHTGDNINYISHTMQYNEWVTNDVSSYIRVSGDGHGQPLFRLAANRNDAWRTRESSDDTTDSPSQGWRYWPTVDTNTGAAVPCAIPVNMRLGIHTNDTTLPARTWWNEGGRLPGFFKSLSGSDAWMNDYYTPGTTITVDGEPYYPLVTGPDTRYRDMFLIRAR